MKTILFSVFFFFSAIALACTNLSGEYEFVKDWNGKLIITQTGCDLIEIRHVNKKNGYDWDFTMTYKIDSENYEGLYYKHLDPKFNIDIASKGIADNKTYLFHKSEFAGNKLSIKDYKGSKDTCGSSYAYNSSACKITEDTYHLDPATNTLIKTQIAHTWAEGGSYDEDEFFTKRIK